MNEGSLGLIIEGLVSVLLVATIFYCISVNRKLERLRHEQKGMHNFIRELSVATGNADKAIQGLRSTVQETGNELAGQIDKSHTITRRLKSEIENAEQTLSKLAVFAGKARQGLPEPEFCVANRPAVKTDMSVDELRHSMIGFEDLEQQPDAKTSTDLDRFERLQNGVA